MIKIQDVQISPRSPEAFATVLGADSVERIRETAAVLKARLGPRVIWNVNTTAAGGGVAEMLHPLLAYARGLEIDTRWVVVGGEPEFFRVTKRLHNALHGDVGDGSPLGAQAREAYDRVIEANARELVPRIKPDDIVILHDPQTAGLIPRIAAIGASVIWRCHIGIDAPSAESTGAWSFLEPYLSSAAAFVFSRFAYVPDFCDHGRTVIVPPTIDPFSPKNQELDEPTVRAILVRAGLVAGSADVPPRYTRGDGTSADVDRSADVLREGPPQPYETPLVVQVSRWDRLKDPRGVMEGFLRALEGPAGECGAQLMLVGPDVKAVVDDPEGAEVYGELADVWCGLPESKRRRVQLVNLPMDDLQENAVMVNAIQRHAAILVQKSLREGFGLTVTEAMWKARPVIGSAVGGIQDQIEHGVSGLLLRDPTDPDAFAAALNQILSSPDLAQRLGRNAKQRVIRQFLGLASLTRYADLIERLDAQRASRRPASTTASG